VLGRKQNKTPTTLTMDQGTKFLKRCQAKGWGKDVKIE
jgi:hypothetical protein